MASGRNQVDYSQNDYNGQTFKIDNSTITYSARAVNGSASVGLAVTYSADDTVALTQDGDHVVGTLLEVFADNFCTVQIEGYTLLPGGASASLTRGKAIVGALGASSAKGYIREVATATAAELGKQAHRIVNVADSANVVVHLGS
jgi:hypothetical protein